MTLPDHLRNRGFSTQTARALCRIPGTFEIGQVYKRDEIVSTLLSSFVRAGGLRSTTNQKVSQVFKGWVRRSDEPFERIRDALGMYRFLGYGDQSDYSASSPVEEDPERGTSDPNAWSPELEYGTGSYEVYAWYLPRYRGGPGARWPIKIGRAGTDGLSRRLQDFWENLPELPCYLLRFACADDAEARERERLLHYYFKSRGQKVEDSPGSEWFLTNPEEIKQAIGFIAPQYVADG